MSDAELEAAARRVVELLRRRGATVALAESCTGGLAAAALTAVAGASDVFWGAAVVYRTEAKTELLELSEETARAGEGVSRETTAALAGAVRARASATYGLAITGWAGPEGGTGDDPVGTVYLALDDGRGVEVERRRVSGGRDEIRGRATRAALDLLAARLDDAGGASP